MLPPAAGHRAGLLLGALSFAVLTMAACQGETSILSSEDIVFELLSIE